MTWTSSEKRELRKLLKVVKEVCELYGINPKGKGPVEICAEVMSKQSYEDLIETEKQFKKQEDSEIFKGMKEVLRKELTNRRFEGGNTYE